MLETEDWLPSELFEPEELLNAYLSPSYSPSDETSDTYNCSNRWPTHKDSCWKKSGTTPPLDKRGFKNNPPNRTFNEKNLRLAGEFDRTILANPVNW
uniref:Uncharacterized protein n=1 Tax=Timema cristinae TaxID=61476 RepID=A0A7R9CAB6_TIMCR|nr:unnamed protein product [Timema cristinae]